MIRAVTFDIWDTIVIDDSDEAKRTRQGLPSKKILRRQLMHQFLSRHTPISQQQVNAVYDRVDAAFNHDWHENHFTWTVRRRLETILHDLGRHLPEEELESLTRIHEEMELQVRPNLAPGITEALQHLHENYRLGVISDTVFSPGRALREMLRAEGLLELFDAHVFSDEIGHAKPAPIVFETAAQILGVTPSEIVHVGDRENNDIAGPHALGAKAILTIVVKDRRQGPTLADAICANYDQLANLVKSLDQE